MATGSWKRLFHLLFMCACVGTGGVCGQTTATESRPSNRTPDKVAQDNVALRLHNLSERLSSLSGILPTVRGLSRFGTAVCSYNKDLARDAFTAANLKLISAEEPYGTKTREQQEYLLHARSLLMSGARQCDSAFARALEAAHPGTTSDQWREARAIGSARMAFDADGRDNAKFAQDTQQAFQDGASGTILHFLVLALARLRATDQEKADSVFLSGLDYLQARTVLSANDLLAFGLYLFTSPALKNDLNRANIRLIARVPMFNVAVARPELSPNVARAYLEAALNILGRATTSPQETREFYLAGVQLLGHIREFCPERTAAAVAMLELLRHQIPDAPDESELRAADGPNLGTKSDVEADIAKIQDEESRDQRYASLVFALYRDREFDKARQIAKKLHDPTNKQLLTLIDFGAAKQLIESGKLPDARAIAARLPGGMENALLYLALAKALAKKDKPLAISDAHLALQNLGVLDQQQGAHLILATAGVLADVDPNQALSTLLQAIDQFNKALPSNDDETRSNAQKRPEVRGDDLDKRIIAPTAFRSEIRIGSAGGSFDLSISGLLAGDFRPVVTSTNLAFDDLESVIVSIQDEDLLAIALPALAAEAVRRDAAKDQHGKSRH